LLLSARPHLSADEQAALLQSTAVDLGAPGPDNAFGYGRLDVASALDRALAASRARPLTLAVLGVITLSLLTVMLVMRSRTRP
jgi:hypothetical protein